MELTGQVAIIRDVQELWDRTAHLFGTAQAVSCAANDLFTWASSRSSMSSEDVAAHRRAGKRIRKVYRPGVLLDPSTAQHLRQIQRAGADIRISQNEINETIILDDRVAILAGDNDGERSYSVITVADVVRGVASLYEAAWRAATPLASYDAQIAEIRELAPKVLDLLNSGCKDESAARTLGLSVRTYRRRVAELMAALGAESRFQAGVRARELGLV